MSDPETIRTYDAKAADYAALTDDYNSRDPILAHFITACPPGGRVLDLGCGPGAAAAVMASAGLVVDAMDASARMVEMAGQHDGVTAWQGTFDDITGDGIYDGVWANFSLLHAPRADLPRHLAALKRAMTPGARLHIAVKLGEGETRDSLGRHYTYWTPDALCDLLTAQGFDITAQATGSGTGLDGSASDWIAVAANA